METLADRILASPTAPRIVARVEAVLRAEAERRAAFHDAITEDDKAEFINGETVVHSPARNRHNLVVRRLFTLLNLHVTRHDLGLVGVEKYLVSLTRNDYEPDVCFWRRATADLFEPDQVRFPAPDLICEVLSPTTRDTDLGLKPEDYAAHGVTEYWVADPDAQTLRQFVLHEPAGDGAREEDTYTLRLLSDTGSVRSVAVEGFAAPIPALFDETAFREVLA